MPRLDCDISGSLMSALEVHCAASGETLEHVVMRALADALQVDHGTLFQVSTSGALVEGVTGGAVTVGTLLEHGTLGLGTFADLDGEMVVLGGGCYRVRGSGEVALADASELVPFAVVTDFRSERTLELAGIASMDSLVAQLDALRTTANQFFAVRLAGTFSWVKTRAVCKTRPGESLVGAAERQAEFVFEQVPGTLVGFWSPEYAKSVNVAGWHLHFLSDDRASGGHLLDCRAEGLRAEIEHLSDFRMAIPETAAFLRADLTQDRSEALARAERER